MLVALSPAGRVIGERLMKTDESLVQNLVADWAPGDLPHLQRLLRQLIAGLEMRSKISPRRRVRKR